ncbi:MAG: ABC transporter permease [Lachnospiraceae bacterium]|nr:ABC transporter permease [Lachnospiraceae bacterium]
MEYGKARQGKNANALEFIIKNRVTFILITICLLITAIQPVFFQPRNILNILRQISASAVLGVGFTLILGSGNIDLSVGTQIGMMGVLMAMLSKVPGMPFIVVIAAGIGMGIVCGTLNAVIINMFNLPPFIVTLATMSIYKGICYIVSNTTPISGIAKYITVVGQEYFLGLPITVWIMIITAIFMAFVINKTIFGRHAIAMGGNSEAARVSGINIKLVRIGIFIVMGLCSFVAALIMTGRASSAQPMAGQGMEMDAIAAVVIGGTPMNGGDAKVGGTLLGCIIVGVINNGLNLLNVNSNFQLIVKGLLILFAIILDAESAKFFNSRKNQ